MQPTPFDSPVTRTFLGWDRPVLDLVCELLADAAAPAITPDLSAILVIVPTREAGRRLRERLAARFAAENRALIPPLVTTPDGILDAAAEPLAPAGPAAELLAWSTALHSLKDSPAASLFGPGADRRRNDFRWVFGVAARLAMVRAALAENGLDMHAATWPEHARNILPESERSRWDALASLQDAADAALRSVGLTDRNAALIRGADAAALPERFASARRVVVASVPDPLPLAVTLIERLPAATPVEVLIHAPESMASRFDHAGRPHPDAWGCAPVPGMADTEGARVRVFSSPGAECAAAAAEVASGGAPSAGAANDDVREGLLRALNDYGLTAHDPEGRPLARNELFATLDAISELAGGGRWDSFARFAHIPEPLGWLRRQIPKAIRPSASELLDQLDRFHADHLPATPVAAAQLARQQAAKLEGDELLGHRAIRYRRVAAAAEAAAALVRRFRDLRPPGFRNALLDILSDIYERRIFSTGAGRPDAEFAETASAATTLAEEIDSACEMVGSGFNGAAALSALRRLLSDTSASSSERREASVDVLGWLELAWDDTPGLVITGMNEGSVPASINGDAFLPDRLREALGLRSNRSRLARDAFLLTAMTQQRADGRGRLMLTFSKTSATGEPLRPSRLLFLVPDEALAGHVKRLFGPVEDCAASGRPPWQRSWRLEPKLPRGADSFGDVCIDKLSVTAFGDFLACPFRFYLKRVLKMEAFEPEAIEMSASAFGSLVHAALKSFSSDSSARDSTDPREIRAFVVAQLRDLAAETFGSKPSAPVRIQIAAAEQRLRRFADVQAQRRRDGWKIFGSELALADQAPLEFAGLTVTGSIDRVDYRDSESGRTWHVLDYKTRAKSESPAAAHLATPTGGWCREDWLCCEIQGSRGQLDRRWVNLQLPLYVLAWRRREPAAARVEAGYFHLPAAIEETAIEMWEGLDHTLLEKAERCAEEVARRVAAREFWPPADTVKFDDFSGILFSGTADSIGVWPPSPRAGMQMRQAELDLR